MNLNALTLAWLAVAVPSPPPLPDSLALPLAGDSTLMPPSPAIGLSAATLSGFS